MPLWNSKCHYGTRNVIMELDMSLWNSKYFHTFDFILDDEAQDATSLKEFLPIFIVSMDVWNVTHELRGGNMRLNLRRVFCERSTLCLIIPQLYSICTQYCIRRYSKFTNVDILLVHCEIIELKVKR